MGLFNVRISKTAEAEFLKIPFPLRRQINQALFKLKDVPLPPGAEAVEPPIYRLLVHGWFVVYEMDAAARIVTVFRIYR